MKSLTHHIVDSAKPTHTMCGEAIDHSVAHLVDERRPCHYCEAALNQRAKPTKYIVVQSTNVELVESFLPSNYSVLFTRGNHLVVCGKDSHGWTAEGYVIPRLGSGLIAAKLMTPDQYHSEHN